MVKSCVMKGTCDTIISLKNRQSTLPQNAVHYLVLCHTFPVVLWRDIPSIALNIFIGIQSCLRQRLVRDWRRSGLEQGWLFSLLAFISLLKVIQDLVISNISKSELNLFRLMITCYHWDCCPSCCSNVDYSHCMLQWFLLWLWKLYFRSLDCC